MTVTSDAAPATTYPHIIDGREVRGTSDPIERHSPATGKLVARYANGTTAEANEAIAAARRTFDEGDWANRSGLERSRILHAVAALIRDRLEPLAVLEASEGGKPLRMARGDIAAAADHFEFAGSLAVDQHGDTFSNLGGQHLGLVFREPIGVAGLIIPWNFPALIFGQKVPYAIAAGCSVVVKPSEFTSGTAIEMARLSHEAGVPAGVLNVVTGYGEPVGQALVENPDVDFISFTGSTATGRRIAESAAATAKKLSLELGGKGANIVFADADLDAAVEGTLKAVFFNTGECCVSGTRLLIEASIAEQFCDRLVQRTRQLRTGNPLSEETDLGALIHVPHAEKVMEFIASGIEEGAKLLTGGSRLGSPGSAFVEPTIFSDVTPDMTIFREEIFGPVLSVTSFETMEEAVTIANNTIYGLGNTVWSRDIDKALGVAKRVRSGTVWINNALEGGPQMPFGGVKASGYGREMGRQGFEEFTELKSCVIRFGPHEPYFQVPLKA